MLCEIPAQKIDNARRLRTTSSVEGIDYQSSQRVVMDGERGRRTLATQLGTLRADCVDATRTICGVRTEAAVSDEQNGPRNIDVFVGVCVWEFCNDGPVVHAHTLIQSLHILQSERQPTHIRFYILHSQNTTFLHYIHMLPTKTRTKKTLFTSRPLRFRLNRGGEPATRARRHNTPREKREIGGRNVMSDCAPPWQRDDRKHDLDNGR